MDGTGGSVQPGTSLQWWPKVDVCTRVLEQRKPMDIVYIDCTTLYRLILFQDQEWLAWNVSSVFIFRELHSLPLDPQKLLVPEISFGEEFHN